MLRYMVLTVFILAASACSEMNTSPTAQENDIPFQCRNACEFHRDNCLGDLPINSANPRALTCKREFKQCLAQCSPQTGTSEKTME